ncbi:hypothetical protein [Shimwellia blattae]|uniref:Uncharacterized protein n=1 Tax=Shimwellia blattae (strain ATCC 29907 / DSM 4481 / JCM 1650 / NBRC 105725 / CDC 9005-74) TaxID=630626 RepID=I2B9J2_SHIBC|nr:hypothetical protein [Shimwellia blattae]AFJ47196.1 hypothetical protein EBL_c21050 [Shimwellia blattae DSM 4481 = NBRC 105725]GAB82275.1 hypothetical protein EB105725_21_00730 [Shimwellia blattae DSM 4481 = NBRC 105725]
MFAGRAVVPVLRGELTPGAHVLVSAVWAGDTADFAPGHCPQVVIDDMRIRILVDGTEKSLSLLPEICP